MLRINRIENLVLAPAETSNNYKTKLLCIIDLHLLRKSQLWAVKYDEMSNIVNIIIGNAQTDCTRLF